MNVMNVMNDIWFANRFGSLYFSQNEKHHLKSEWKSHNSMAVKTKNKKNK